MPFASIGPISTHLPERVEDNDQLGAEFPEWNMDAIGERTGIFARHIAAPDECSSDLGVAAAEKLFGQHDVDPESIDFILLCTQTPDYPLPTTACIMQERLGLPKTAGALDFNLGCSGFVYGLSLADGLIRSGAARRILFITAETYSKFIDPTDRSLRTIFGDGAAATLIEASETQSISAFKFGTDGSGADTLIVNQGGYRTADCAIKPRHRHRWPSSIYMDGPTLMAFAGAAIPPLVDSVLEESNLAQKDVDFFLFHQATRKMLDHLRQLIDVDSKRLPIELANYGNTVSSTLPILMHDMRNSGRLRRGTKSMLVGFGVGLSWAGCMWNETWENRQVNVDADSDAKADSDADAQSAA